MKAALGLRDAAMNARNVAARSSGGGKGTASAIYKSAARMTRAHMIKLAASTSENECNAVKWWAVAAAAEGGQCPCPSDASMQFPVSPITEWGRKEMPRTAMPIYTANMTTALDRRYPMGVLYAHMKVVVKKKLVRRLKIIEGQVRGLQKMVAEDAYCIDIITQASAVRQALSAVEDAMLENHLSTHVVEQMRGGAQKKAVSEILAVYKISKRK